MWDDINNLKRRLIYLSYDEIIDMLEITEEELVERFEDKIDPEKLYYLVEEEESDCEEDVGGALMDDDPSLPF